MKILRKNSLDAATPGMSSKLLSVAYSFILTVVLSACESGGGGFDFLTTPTTTGTPDCAITTTSPVTTSTLKVSAVPSTSTTFSVGLSTATDCAATFVLNGVAVSSSNGVSVALLSSALTAGTNTLVATAGGTTKIWTIYKNTVPLCGVQTPATTGNSMAPGGSLILTGNASDADTDTLSFTWKVNGVTVPSGELSVFNGTNQSQATFVPTVAYLGANSVSMLANDGTDTTACSWNVGVAGTCTIAATTPSNAGQVRVPFLAGTNTLFQASASAGCNFTWTLNGTTITGASGASQNLNSSDLLIGANILGVSVTNGTTSDSKTWTVVKNSPPSCASQTPAPTGSTLGVGGALALTATGSDLNADPLTYSWKNNGTAIDPGIFVVVAGAGNSQATFSPNAGYVGTNNVRADISDGYDTSACSWSVNVVPVCAIASATPSSSTLKIPYNPSTANAFVAVPNDASCTLTWSLNGTPLGGTSAFNSVLSSAMSDAPATNTLIATATNGYTTATKTWTVTKNTVPTCSSQVPAATGTTIGVGGVVTLTANASNADGDTNTFTWQRNGSTANPTFFNVASTANQTVAVFTPNSSFVGSNTIKANISDGYDATYCQWDVAVVNNCIASSTLPSSTTVKVANASTTSTSFGIVPNDVACVVSWTLNGNPVTGGNFISVLSSDLLSAPASNTLVATLDNGLTAVTTRTWTLSKNRVPTCVSQTPAATPPAMNYQSTASYTALAGDPDGDSLSNFTWKFNGTGSGTLFNPVSTVGNTSVTTFRPTLSQVGPTQTITTDFDDSFDAGVCTWTLAIQDPNTVQISNCSPNTGSTVVVQSAGAQSNQTLQVSATGTSLTYSWLKNGTTQPGYTTPSLSVTAASLTVGNYTFRGLVTDQYTNSAYCEWTVKRNAPPVLDSALPDNTITYKMNATSTLGFSVTASDANVGDSLSYTWAIDGTTVNAMLPTGSSTATFSPALDPAGLDAQNFPKILGAHVITVTVSDGAESVTNSWNVEVNLFSNECNTLSNGSVASTGGKICTLVGSPTIGSGSTPSDDQTAFKIRPAYVVDDGAGNWFYSDVLNHTVSFYNRSGSSISKFGKTIPAGKSVVLIGNGADGITQDNLYNTSFKLSTPYEVAYDSAAQFLYIADSGNHRVARIDSTGFVTTVFGITGSATNTPAANTDGALGTTHGCGAPTGLRLVNYGGNRWLYIACNSTNTIKKMDADPLSGNYLKGYTVVGRLAVGVAAAGNEDGPIGGAGHARVNGPWALTDDGFGNIYWTETGGLRTRMAATGGATVSFFTSGLTPGNTTTISATDATTALTAGSITTTALSALVTASPVLTVNAPNALTTATGCIPVRVQARNNVAQTYIVGAAVPITLSSAGGTGTFYSDFNCSASIGTSTSIGIGTSETLFYYKNTVTVGAATITAASAGFTSGVSANIQVAAAGATPTKLIVNTAANYNYLGCSMVVVQVQNATSAASPLASAITVRLNHNGIGNFYTASTCTGTPTTTFTIGVGASQLILYYAGTAIAPANQVVSLFGNAALNTSNPTTPGTLAAPNAVGIGAITLYSPRGLAVHTSGGAVKGFFVSNYAQQRITYVNNQAVDVNNMGGSKVPVLTGGLVLGTGTGSPFNSDGVGNVSRIQTPMGINIDSGGTNLLVADMDNYRLRTFNFNSANGEITTSVGAGRIRAGNLGNSAIGAKDMYLSSPSQVVFDSTNRKLYISDSGNSRIRRVDMLRGLVDTAVGNGSGAATIENETPSNVLMTSPRGLALISKSGVPFLLYADQAATTGVNVNCMIRGWNLGVTNQSLFGTTVSAGRVSTLIGDFGLGCNVYNSGSGGLNTAMYNPESITTDGTNLLVTTTNTTATSDHCILKVDASGNVAPIVGVCGTTGMVDGSTQGGVARLRFPTAIVMDPLYTADGNFFFADSIDQAQTRIRYVNFRTSAVTIGGASVPAAVSGFGIVQTIWTVTPSGTTPGWVYGLAAFSNQLCIAGGRPALGNQGSHNVTCYNRTNPVGPVTLRVGPNEASNPPTRGGAPIDMAQEGVLASSALLNAPYGIAFDSAGNLYISERNNHLIRMVRRWNDPSF